MTMGAVATSRLDGHDPVLRQCHTMQPELKAYEVSRPSQRRVRRMPHGARPEGWVKAKLNGTRQLIELITGDFPTPIPPPDHAALPVDRVHLPALPQRRNSLVAAGGPIKLVLHNQYALDARLDAIDRGTRGPAQRLRRHRRDRRASTGTSTATSSTCR